jgi:hypothetical protein
MDISIETGMSRALISVNGAGAALTCSHQSVSYRELAKQPESASGWLLREHSFAADRHPCDFIATHVDDQDPAAMPRAVFR